MLHCDYCPADQSIADNGTAAGPLLVFVHGLLGSGRDWHGVLSQLSAFPRLTLDLPGHGNSRDIEPQGFERVCHEISHAIAEQRQQHGLPSTHPVALVGYSLGARLVMYGLANGCFSGLHLVCAVLEGGNFGLHTEQERQDRLASDRHWAARFAGEPIEQVLDAWYRQPVFASLDRSQREQLVAKRAENQGFAVANMLLSTSLAKQPQLMAKMQSSNHVLHYVCGEKDKKFLALARASGLSYTAVQGAGHNVHHESPQQFAQLIGTLLAKQTVLPKDI